MSMGAALHCWVSEGFNLNLMMDLCLKRGQNRIQGEFLTASVSRCVNYPKLVSETW